MKDKFDIHKWKRELAERDFQLNENVNPIELKRNIEDKMIEIFTDARDIEVELPNDNRKGKITVTMKRDLPDEDIQFSKIALEKLGLKYDEQDSFPVYDVEPGEKIMYPRMYFTYL